MLIAIADAETTGLARSDYKSLDNPYLASFTLLIYDTEKQMVQASLNTMIQPDGWEMPPEAGAINGLDTETLDMYGIPLKSAMKVMCSLLEPVTLLVAHNTPFDVKVFAAAMYRSDLLEEVETFLELETYCTMRESKHIVQAKNKKGNLKMPKLTEAYEFFFNETLDNAHSANADTVACLEIYLAIQEHNEEEAAGDREGVSL